MLNLNLLVLRCRDIEVSRRFYECLELRFQKHAHGTGPEHYAAEDGDGVMELYPLSQPCEREVEATGLGFTARSLPPVSDALRSSGFDPQPAREQPWGRTFVVRDPDGRRVEVKQLADGDGD